MTDALERERLLRTAEAAKLVGFSTKHLLRLVNSEEGAPQPYRLGRRHLAFKVGHLLDWIERSKQPTLPERNHPTRGRAPGSGEWGTSSRTRRPEQPHRLPATS